MGEKNKYLIIEFDPSSTSEENIVKFNLLIIDEHKNILFHMLRFDDNLSGGFVYDQHSDSNRWAIIRDMPRFKDSIFYETPLDDINNRLHKLLFEVVRYLFDPTITPAFRAYLKRIFKVVNKYDIKKIEDRYLIFEEKNGFSLARGNAETEAGAKDFIESLYEKELKKIDNQSA